MSNVQRNTAKFKWKIGDLFKRKTELSTALQIKHQPWTDNELAEFSASLLAHYRKSKYQLHPDTLVNLYGSLHQIKSPLARYIFTNTLKELGSTMDKSAIALAYINTSSLELAPIDSETLADSNVVNALFDYGPIGASLLGQALLSGSWAPRSSQSWLQLFRYATESKNSDLVRALWACRNSGSLSPKLHKLPVPSVSMLLKIAGYSRDKSAAKDLLYCSTADIPIDSEVASDLLNIFLNDPPDQLMPTLQQVLESTVEFRLFDFWAVADRLADDFVGNVALVADSTDQRMFDILLLSLYRRYSSLTVLHGYRCLKKLYKSYRPGHDAVQILASAAYRLGNSKLLGYRIWEEATSNLGLTPTRKFCETILMCQMTGNGYRTSLYFLAEMHRRSIYLRGHMQKLLARKFEAINDGDIYLDIFKATNISQALEMYSEFDVPTAEQECHPFSLQAQRNAEIFLQGKDPDRNPMEVLSEMLEFDRKK